MENQLDFFLRFPCSSRIRFSPVFGCGFGMYSNSSGRVQSKASQILSSWSKLIRSVISLYRSLIVDLRIPVMAARFKRLLWQADKGLVGQVNLQNMTAHRWFENKSCPGDYIYNRLGQIAKEVNQKLSGASAGPFKPYQGQVNADDGLNCRTAPVNGQVLKTYPDGTVLTITKEDERWGHWGYCGEGWVCLDYINKIASAKDPAAKEESIMDGKQFKKMYDDINPTYNTIDEVPSYWRDDIRELVEKGIISGVGGGKLGLTHSDCKAAVLAKRIAEKLK